MSKIKADTTSVFIGYFFDMNSRDTCIFYRSMFESIKELPKENQAELYNAIFKDKDKDKDKHKDEDKDKVKSAKAPDYTKFTNQDLIDKIKPLIDKFGKDTCNAFYSYWSEPLANGKMRLTNEKAWDTHRRLSSWKQREKQPTTNFVKQGSQPVVFNRSSQGQKYVGDDVI